MMNLIHSYAHLNHFQNKFDLNIFVQDNTERENWKQ